MIKTKRNLVTRIVRSKDLTYSKLSRLRETAQRLADVRSYAWRHFGSISGDQVSANEVRNLTKRAFDNSGIPANLRFATAMDAADNIKAFREAAKALCKQKVFRHTTNKNEHKRLFTLLKSNKFHDDPFLRRIMRKAYRRGVNHVSNQIVLWDGDYRWFASGSKGWIEVLSLTPRKRIAIPLASNHPITGIIRLIVDESGVAVHHTIEVSQGKPCGTQTIGVDRGYTEVFVDSDGGHHGNGLGNRLSKESDHLKAVYANRSKLTAIADKSNPSKQSRIRRHNLGQKKLLRRKKRHQLRVAEIVSKACHSVCDKANVIASEDLTGVIRSTKPRSKGQKRRMSGWVKGVIAKSLESVSHRRGSSIVVVNCAYSSQACSSCGCLGTRTFDKFHCTSCGALLHADENAAKNVLARIHDTEICRFVPFARVKQILLARSALRSRQTDQDTSCGSLPSTVSEIALIELIV